MNSSLPAPIVCARTLTAFSLAHCPPAKFPIPGGVRVGLHTSPALQAWGSAWAEKLQEVADQCAKLLSQLHKSRTCPVHSSRGLGVKVT